MRWFNLCKRACMLWKPLVLWPGARKVIQSKSKVIPGKELRTKFFWTLKKTEIGKLKVEQAVNNKTDKAASRMKR